MQAVIDWISNLPDDVLCHILSFLPTTQVVATSVLSKRWTDLWRLVPTLNLMRIRVNDRETYFRFNEFVYSVLLARNSIKTCFLDIWYGDARLGHLGYVNFIKWINAVVQRGVERLEFCAGVYDNLKLPISILTCNTLVIFRVCGFTFKGFSSITLPSLKILRLVQCTFINARDFVLLLSGCPILEDLDASAVEFHTQDSLSYQDCQILDLKKLTIAQMPCTFCHFPLKPLHNVEELYIEINKVYHRFDQIPTFHNLTKLKLHSINSNWDLLVRVLNHCPNLQNVELNKGTFIGVGLKDDVQKSWVDPIYVPQCLSLHLKTCKFKFFTGQQDEFLLAAYILKNARVLQIMTIGCLNDLTKERELSLCPRASPTCQLILNVNTLYIE